MSEVVRIRRKPRLRIVEKASAKPDGAPSYAYEAEQRRHIMSRDWAAAHVAGDHAQPINLTDRGKWKWR